MNTIATIRNSELDNEKLSHIFTPKNTPLDNIDFTKVIVKKPWGHEYVIYDDGNASIWVMHLHKGGSTSMHCHIYKKTALVVLKGKAITTTLNDGFMLKEGDGLVLEKKVFHATQAASEEETIVLELETPSKKTDVVRLVDLYGRETAGYESESKMIPGNASEHVFFTPLETNTIKSIGNMHLSLHSFSADTLLNSINKDEICVVLDGEIRDEKLRQVYKKGDLLRVQVSNDALRTLKDSKILHITPASLQLTMLNG